jgi:hypothetical protein
MQLSDIGKTPKGKKPQERQLFGEDGNLFGDNL